MLKSAYLGLLLRASAFGFRSGVGGLGFRVSGLGIRACRVESNLLWAAEALKIGSSRRLKRPLPHPSPQQMARMGVAGG